MAAKLRKLARLFALYARMDAQWFTQDTLMCVVTVLCETFSNIAATLGVFLVAVRFNGVGDFSADEILFLLGFYTTSTGLYNMLFSGNNTGYISRRIGRGQLDHCLIQPLPLFMQLMTESFLPVSACQLPLCGALILVVACVRLQLAVTPLWVLLLLAFLLCSLLVQLGSSYAVSISAFKHPAGGEEISAVALGFVQSVGYYPLSALPLLGRLLLTTVFPAGCLAWLPSLILLGKSPSTAISFFYPLVAVLLFGAGITLFQKGMKIYARTGSQRYRDMGHRR